MQNFKWIFLGCLSVGSLFASGTGDTELQIKKFRFNRHMKLGFERLVIEFSNQTHSKEVPQIRLLPDTQGKYSTIKVGKASLVGAIPESSINDSYTQKSRYFGPVSINSDTTSGFEIKAFIKQSHTLVEAFWLEKPSRLIIDIFPKNSDRAMGPNVVSKRTTASEQVAENHPSSAKGHNKEGGESHGSKESQHGHGSETTKQKSHWSKSEKPEDESVVCFPANTQVRANIGFEKGTSRTGSNVPTTIDSTYSQASTVPGPESIVCYPKGAQVTMLLKFQPTDNGQYGRADMENYWRSSQMNQRMPSSYPNYNPGYGYPQPPPMMGYPGGNYQPPMPSFSPPAMVNREQLLNNDADVALSLPDDATLRQRAAGNGNYSDNFSQKTIPQSLGKKLPPPEKRD